MRSKRGNGESSGRRQLWDLVRVFSGDVWTVDEFRRRMLSLIERLELSSNEKLLLRLAMEQTVYILNLRSEGTFFNMCVPANEPQSRVGIYVVNKWICHDSESGISRIVLEPIVDEVKGESTEELAREIKITRELLVRIRITGVRYVEDASGSKLVKVYYWVIEPNGILKPGEYSGKPMRISEFVKLVNERHGTRQYDWSVLFSGINAPVAHSGA